MTALNIGRAGFAATVGLSGHVFSERRLPVHGIDTGYQRVSLLGMGVILAIWQQGLFA